MSSFILLYNGPATPLGASHEGWPEWFQRVGEHLVDMGSPMTNGFVVHSDGTTTETAASLNGYSIVRAEDRGEALDLVKDHPFLALGDEYTIEAFEVPNK
jgi:YCII-related domain